MKRILLTLALLLAPACASAQPIGPPNAILCNLTATSTTALSAGTTQMVTGIATARINVCGFIFEGDGNGSAQLVFGTGSSCSSPTNVTSTITTTASSNDTYASPFAWISSALGQSLCIIVTGTTAVIPQVMYSQF